MPSRPMPSDSPIQCPSETSDKLEETLCRGATGSSQVVSPARIFPSLVKALGWRVSDPAYGTNMPASLASYDRATQSWRTSELSLFEGSIPYSGALPRSGTMRSGKIYAPPMLERPTAENESGLWRTPQAANATQGPKSPENFGRCQETGASMITLTDQVRMWPTPRVFMHKDSTTDRGKGNLGEVVGGQLNPTWVEWLMGYPLGWTDLDA